MPDNLQIALYDSGNYSHDLSSDQIFLNIKLYHMNRVMEYALALICTYAFLIYTARLIKLLFNPKILGNKVFDFPQDKLRKALLLVGAMFILITSVLLTLRLI